MVVVFGGVGNLWGAVVAALILGIVNIVLEPVSGAVVAKIAVLVLLILFIQRRPRGLFPLKGQGGRGMMRLRDTHATITIALVLGIALLIAFLDIGTAPNSPVHVPDFVISLVGKYLCYAMLALAVDLVWGYAGILTLGHAAFFALGGYAMGMYLMREIGARGVYANPILPDFMVFLGWKALPWYWYGSNHLWLALILVALVPGLLAFVFGFLTFRSRVSGVYLSIITQALTYALHARLLPQRHGLRRQQRDDRLQGHRGLPDRRPRDRGRADAALGTGPLGGIPARALDRALALRQGSGRRARCRKPHPLPRLPPGIRTSSSSSCSLRSWPASAARSMSRRSASSTRASSPPPIRSRR